MAPTGMSTISQLAVASAECARLIGMPIDTFKKLAADHAWERGELPPPTFTGARSEEFDKAGRRLGKRMWRVASIDAWLVRHEWRPTDG
jgi:hypothetical protein